MHTLIFATHNEHKADEVRSVLEGQFHISTLSEEGIMEEIPEPHDSLEENAREKSSVIWQRTGKDCFSEDTGLEVEVLNGAPGVRSARYAGTHGDAVANMNKLLEAMEGQENRNARFRTVISLMMNGKEHRFEGICPGRITLQPTGHAGFGYDPVFIPEGSIKTFAEMDKREKNLYSHRRKAMDGLIHFLKNIWQG
jgi:XTP/dITP diphosphohydrolase